MAQSLTWKPNDDILVGSALRGRVFTTYDRLVEVFGEPNFEPGDKVWNEWSITFEIGVLRTDDWDLVVVTIYDWKEAGPDDAKRGKYDWHIGGRQHLGVECVYEALEV